QGVEEWAEAAVQEIFGTTALAASPHATGSGSGRLTVRVMIPPDVRNAPKPDARTNEVLAESYAEASVSLGEAVQQIREERDVAQRRLADVLEMLDAARTLRSGAPRDQLHLVVLSSLARELETAQA